MIINNNILKVESLTKSYVRNIINVRGESEDERFYIIDDINLFIPRGKITALIGGNGAGKTTLFNIISGFLPPDSGKIFFKKDDNQYSLIGKNTHKITRLGIGRMFQDSHIFPDMTVLENMFIADENNFGENPLHALFRLKKIQTQEQERLNKVKEIFAELFGIQNDLWEKREYLAGTLSHGQQRLLGLARLFMGKYDLVLLDEPTAGVNPGVIKKIMQIIKKMVKAKGITVFLIEHNMKVVQELSEFCSFMSHGKIAAFGYTQDIIGNTDVRRTYLGV